MRSPISTPIPARGVLALALAALAAGGGGCVSDDPPLTQELPPFRSQPDGIYADTLDLAASQMAKDTNANEYLDTITATVHLFNRRYPYAPLKLPGELKFRMWNSATGTIGEWNLTVEQVNAVAVRTAAGPGYIVDLNINDVATDRLNDQLANLECTFVPTEAGRPTISSARPVTVIIGRKR